MSVEIKYCGSTTLDNKRVPLLGGSFQMSDTMGLPLWAFMDLCSERGFKMSFPHYFASAIEHGWDDIKIFSKIKEVLEDIGAVKDFEDIKKKCIIMFCMAAETVGWKDPKAIASEMRRRLEMEAGF